MRFHFIIVISNSLLVFEIPMLGFYVNASSTVASDFK